MSNNKLRWGIMSTANVGKGSTVPGIQESDRNEVVAVASRSFEKAQAFAKELDIPEAYGSYEELLNNPEIDAVYIPLPNHLHKEWTIKAAKAGKHVLCEKPFALDEDEAAEMVAECDKEDVVLFEAFMYRHQKRFVDIKKRIQDGEIGVIRGIHGVFTFDASGATSNIRFTKEWGGGSIFDVGCYLFSAARFILEEEPVAVTTNAFFSPKHGDVDMFAAGLMEFSNGVSLTFDCGMWADGRDKIEILGTKGRILLDDPVFLGEQSYKIIKSRQVEKIENANINSYKLQADRFAETVLDGKPAPFSLDDPIKNMRAVKGALDSAEQRERIIL